MTNILLTGMTGFIGSHLADALVKRGFDVYGTVRHHARGDIIPQGVVPITCDITNYHSVLGAMKTTDPDIILHLAALTPVRYSFEHPFNYEQINFKGTMNVAHAIMELPDSHQKRLVIASTAEVYGIQEPEPFTEDLPLNPSSPYAVSKAAADLYVRMMAKVYDLDYSVMRPSNTYGRKNEAGFIVEYLITTMLKGETAYVGAPDSIRDYIYIDDQIGAYLLAAEKGLNRGEAHNAGSGIGMSNRGLALGLANILGYNPDRIVFGSYPPEYPSRPIASDQPYLVLDSTKLRSLGWPQPKEIDGYLKQTIDYWRGRI